jgi:hypothetical protein
MVVLGSRKRHWPWYFASVTGLEYSNNDRKLIVCCWFESITTDELVFLFVTAYRYITDEVIKSSIIWISLSTTDRIELTWRIYHRQQKNQRTSLSFFPTASFWFPLPLSDRSCTTVAPPWFRGCSRRFSLRMFDTEGDEPHRWMYPPRLLK